MPKAQWRSPLLIAGAAIWLACLVVWGLTWAVNRTMAAQIAGVFAAFFVGGKIAAVPLGHSFGLPWWVIALTVFVPDLGAVLASFPLMHSSLDVLGRWSKFVRRLHVDAVAAAQKRKGFVHRFGSVGLFLMALSPIGFYSPILVAALGQLMGLSAPRVILPVVAGMVVMTLVLVTALGAALSAVADLDPRLPFVLSVLLLVTFVSLDAWRRQRKRRRAAKEPDGPGPRT